MPSEFSLIDRYFARATPQAVLGPGDDCALLAPSPGMELAITTDMLVSGTHFLPDTDPFQLGWKTLAVNLSDLGAMGAVPRWVLLAGSLPKADEVWLAAFSEGLFACAGRYGVDLVGGDTTRGPLNLCITALGEVPVGTALRRDAARVGDDLWVSGRPGLAALGLAQLQGRASLPGALAALCIRALQQPVPRVELGLALRSESLARAAIDVSDGLLADVGHIAERSRLDLEVLAEQLPALPAGAPVDVARHCQLAGGDDYELAFMAPPENRSALAALAARLDLPLWRIGHAVAGNGEVRLLDAEGRPVSLQQKGFDHFG
ncbi:thiamine-phosphate kinase [uncultured Propionivibrio sp.]|uniref:thiamine-phosphate kinase n=1 Tax=uncultured Propionivibrio sp. TaxID=426737 RepID=UPI0029BFDDE7|nr:thiamine-phosphate kinase [uncultured Propionivibrio sp.]